MKQNFIELFEYNDWANSVLIDALIKLDSSVDKTVRLINHIISAQDLWLERIQNQTSWDIELWEEHSLHECYALSGISTNEWLKYINRNTEKTLREEHTYYNSKNEQFTNKIYQTINHVITHSHYHRGQINLLLRESSESPVECDYIYFLRK